MAGCVGRVKQGESQGLQGSQVPFSAASHPVSFGSFSWQPRIRVYVQIGCLMHARGADIAVLPVLSLWDPTPLAVLCEHANLNTLPLLCRSLLC